MKQKRLRERILRITLREISDGVHLVEEHLPIGAGRMRFCCSTKCPSGK
jgi:hypothetical protein